MCLRYSSSVVAPTQRSSPAREHRLEHVRRVDRALGRTRADDRVQLVDEQDQLALRVADLLQHRLQPLLELAAVLRAGKQRADVERPHALPFQRLGDVARNDPLREPLHDRRLARARLADQHRVVLRAPREHLDHAPDLLVAADHRVELPRLRRGREIAAELLQRLIVRLRVLRGDALPAADLLNPGEQLVARHEVECQQQVLGGDIVVLHPLRLVKRLVEHAVERGRGARLLRRPFQPRLGPQHLLGLRLQRRRVRDELPGELLLEQRHRQMLRVDLRVAASPRHLQRCGDGLLCFHRQLVEVHRDPFSLDQ
jgi:hypothetical protein